MFLLIALTNQQQARSFIDYMQHQGIKIILVEERGNYELWLQDQQQLDYVRRCLRHFLENPNDTIYKSISWEAGKSFISLSANGWWGLGEQLIRPVGVITLNVTLISVLVFVSFIIFHEEQVFQWLHYPLVGQRWQLWRYITPIFMHFSATHIIFNLMWWWYLGDRVEHYQGKGFLLVFVILTAIISNYFQSIVSIINFGGLSGVVYGLFGYSWIMGKRYPQKGIYLEKGLLSLGLIWLVLGFTQLFGSLANVAHCTGLVAGVMLAYCNTGKWPRFLRQ